MDLTSYVDALRQELAVAAEAGGEDARALAERLTAPLESAIRLTLLEALSAAADEITRDLAPGSVEVRLRGREPGFVVTPAAHRASRPRRRTAPAPCPRVAPRRRRAAPRRGSTSASPTTSRAGIEEAAGQAGLSVNAWLVRAAAAALESDARGPARRQRRRREVRQRYTGWVR